MLHKICNCEDEWILFGAGCCTHPIYMVKKLTTCSFLSSNKKISKLSVWKCKVSFIMETTNGRANKAGGEDPPTTMQISTHFTCCDTKKYKMQLLNIIGLMLGCTSPKKKFLIYIHAKNCVSSIVSIFQAISLFSCAYKNASRKKLVFMRN